MAAVTTLQDTVHGYTLEVIHYVDGWIAWELSWAYAGTSRNSRMSYFADTIFTTYLDYVRWLLRQDDPVAHKRFLERWRDGHPDT